MVAGPLGEMTLGDPKAPNTVIEYASMTCSHCANFHNTVYSAFKAKYIDTNQIRFVFREFPTPPQDVAAAGFLMLVRPAEPHAFHRNDAQIVPAPRAFVEVRSAVIIQ